MKMLLAFILFLKCTCLVVADELIFHSWDKNMSQIAYHVNLCPMVCFKGQILLLKIKFRCIEVKCFPCNCQYPQCQVYGICCPEVDLLDKGNSSLQTFRIKDTRVFSTEKSLIKANNRNLICEDSEDKEYLMIRSCAENYSDPGVKRWCEDKWANQDLGDQLVDLLTRVSDLENNVTYYNKFCTECNYVTKVQPWNLLVECTHHMFVYKAVTQSELFKLSLNHSSACKVLNELSHQVIDTVKCMDYENWLGKAVIDQCNVTGLWTAYDQDVESSCRQMADYTFNVIVNSVMYSNVFCAICNSDHYPVQLPFYDCLEKTLGPPIRELPFTMLLNFYEDTSYHAAEKMVDICSSKEWKGPDNRCFPILCTYGKVYVNNSCVTALNEIRGLGYRAKFLLKLNMTHENFIFINNTNYFSIVGDELANKIKQWLLVNFSEIAHEMSLNFNMTYPQLKSNELPLDLYFYMSIEIDFISLKTKTRDETENFLFSNLFDEKLTLFSHTNAIEFLPVNFIKFDYLERSEPNFSTYSNEIKINVDFPSYFTYTMWNMRWDFLYLNEILLCPFVQFNETNFSVHRRRIANELSLDIISVSFEDLTLRFDQIEDYKNISIQDDNSVIICVDLLNRKLELYSSQQSKSQVFFAVYVLTLICLGVSIVCLTLTMITYFTFQTLRNVAGIHNMFLSSSLLLAQILLLVAAHVEAPSLLCTILGMATHFMWLFMFTWSFLCCFHMFRIFNAKNRTSYSTAQYRSLLIKRVVVSFLAPACIVTSVILYDFFTSKGKTIGYGVASCYLNSVRLTIVSMATPLVFVLICNIVFFSSSVYQIYKVKKLQGSDEFKKSDHQSLCIYIKLSSMTGMFWVLALLSEGLNYDPLRFVAVVMNGSQGLFIFISYMCNKRVLALYKQSLLKEDTSSLTEKGTFSKLVSQVQQQQNK